MTRTIGLLLILVLAAGGGFAAEPPRGAGGGSPLLRMEELKVLGDAPLRMEELEVRGFQDKSDLYLPVHRSVALPSPVRHDLFLEDMARPVFPRGGFP